MTAEQPTFAQALLDPAHTVSGLRAWNSTDSQARFAIYRNNVMVSLVDALADTFSVCQQLVGELFFRAMAAEFVRLHPPTSPILAHYGGALPDFIRAFPPAASVPYLADVARLEYARVQSYHAADDVVVSAENIAAAINDPERIHALRFTLHSSVHVIESAFAVCSIWAAHQSALPIENLNPEPAETALVFRRDFDVEVMQVPTAAGLFFKHLLLGNAVMDAATVALSENADFSLTDALTIAIREPLICAITHAPSE
jgi:hypothetical protein